MCKQNYISKIIFTFIDWREKDLDGTRNPRLDGFFFVFIIIVTASSVRLELLRDSSGSALRERSSMRLVVNEDALAIQSFLSVSL